MSHPNTRRRPRLLWANAYCLMDLSSGASMAVREMLIQLVGQGYEVEIIGATVFDAESGRLPLRAQWDRIQHSSSPVVTLKDPPLTHRLVKTASIERGAMTTLEQTRWLDLYTQTLERFRPDLVFFYGGRPLDLLAADEAHSRGIPCVAYLANGNYRGTRWCRDVDLILTDSEATASHYRMTQGIAPRAIGAFIDAERVVAPHHERRRVLVVNPSPQKGGAVVVTPTTRDMRPVYGRARLLLAPSLWWESFGRVAAEAMLNGIPAIVSNRGGLPEVVGEGGVHLDFPEVCYQPPYGRVPGRQWMEALVQHIERFFDDDAYHEAMAARARAQGERHGMAASTERLCAALAPLVVRRAGDSRADRRPNKQLHGPV